MPIALRTSILCALLSLSLSSSAQQKPSPFVKQNAPMLVLDHVRLIDGTGAAPQEDMRITIAAGKIAAVGTANANAAYPPDDKVLDMTGKTIIPGLVGMHEHLFYPTPRRPAGGAYFYGEAVDSAPRLYLAGGVTTARTGGSVDPYTDLELKRAIERERCRDPSSTSPGPISRAQASLPFRCTNSPAPKTPLAWWTIGRGKASPRSRLTTTSRRKNSKPPSTTPMLMG